MILLADSGSTKTDWKILNESSVVDSYTTKGINPVLQNLDDIQNDQLAQMSFIGKYDITEIEFYGAGCATTLAQDRVKQFLTTCFPMATSINISSDLMAAAKALFGNDTGIACILGTGSNSGYFEKGLLKKQVPSLGYILGDEGGGVQIGRQLIVDLLRDNMPEEMSAYIQDKVQMTKNEILEKVYQSTFPNRFMAQFVGLVHGQFADHPYFYQLARYQLNLFFENCLNKYEIGKTIPLGFVGSVAFYFQPIIMDLASIYGYQVSDIVQRPIDVLIQKKLSAMI